MEDNNEENKKRFESIKLTMIKELLASDDLEDFKERIKWVDRSLNDANS